MVEDNTSRTVEQIDFYFDPLCPWAYQTSLWIREIRERTGLKIDWRFFSLEEINRQEGKKHPWEREWSHGWGLMRVGALLRRRSMQDLDNWYGAVGAALHAAGIKPHQRAVAAEIAERLGLGSSVVDEALGDQTTNDDVKADHDRVVREHGAFGVPTIVFPDGQALFGPKFTPAPTGDDAERMWEMTLDWLEFPYLYEIKRPQIASDIAHIGRSFEPYLSAREWGTIENPAPGA